MYELIMFLIYIFHVVLGVIHINGEGSAFMTPLMRSWSFAYQTAKSDVTIEYTSSTSSDGMEKLANNEIDFVGIGHATEGIKMVPIVASEAAIVVNLPTVPKVVLTLDVFVNILNGSIIYWDNTRIQELNEAYMPTEKINIVLEEGKSEIITILSHGLSLSNKYWNEKWGIIDQWPDEIINQEHVKITNSMYGVTGLVKDTLYTISYAPYSFVNYADLQFVSLLEYGKIVEPIHKYIDTWPLTTFGYMVINNHKKDMHKFIRWILTDKNAKKLALIEGFVPLTKNISEQTIEEMQIKIKFNESNDTIYRIVFKILAGIAGLIAIMYFLFMLYKKNTTTTKVTGLAFTSSFLMGCLLNYASVFFWTTIPKNNIICQMRAITTGLGFSMMLGTMFAKTQGICNIIDMANNNKLGSLAKMTWKNFFKYALGIIIIQIIILIFLMILDPPYSFVKIIDEIDQIAIHSCKNNNGFNKWKIIQACYFVILIIWGGIIAYKARHFWDEMDLPNESKCILWSIYDVGICSVTYLVVARSLDTDTSPIIFLTSFACFLPTTIAFQTIFGPKIYKIITTPSEFSLTKRISFVLNKSSPRRSGVDLGEKKTPDKKKESEKGRKKSNSDSSHPLRVDLPIEPADIPIIEYNGKVEKMHKLELVEDLAQFAKKLQNPKPLSIVV